AAKYMKDVRLAQVCRAVRGAVFIYEERKSDLEFFAEAARKVHPAQAYRGYVRAFSCNLFLVITQLRDVLAAEDSTPMPQEDNDRRLRLPQRPQPDLLAFCVRQGDGCEARADRVRHGLRFSGAIARVSIIVHRSSFEFARVLPRAGRASLRVAARRLRATALSSLVPFPG